MTLASAAPTVVRRPRPGNTGGVSLPPLATDKMAVGHHLHRVTVGTCHAVDAMIAGPHRHLALAETTMDARTIEVVTAVIVAIHSPQGGIIDGATQSRGRHLVSIMNVDVSALRHTERAHGTDTRITSVDEDAYSLGVSTLHARVVFFCLRVDHRILENPALPLNVPTLCHIRYFP